jgi:transglutaminase-like putative cysteine protease
MTGDCVTFLPGLEAFAQVAPGLVRPWEVAHLIRPGRRADPRAVGRWLRQERAAGRLRYLPDQTSPRDHWCSPAATITRGGGDCEDLALVALTLLAASGVEGWIVVGWREREGRAPESHAWAEGDGWHLEATSGRVSPARPPGYRAVRELR